MTKRTSAGMMMAALLASGAATSASAGTVAYRNTVLADTPIVYYEFDEVSGTTATNSALTGATYTGTFNTTGGTITVGQTSFAQGGTAYDFGGGFIGSASALLNSLTEWTVEAWVSYDANKVNSSTIVSNDQGGWNNDVLIGIVPEDTAGSGLSNGQFGVTQQSPPSGPRDVAGADLAADTWAHVAVVGSTINGTLTLYINGVQVAQDSSLTGGVTFNGADGLGTANLTIGAARPDSGDPGYRPFDGLLDEVAIYDQALTSTDFLARVNVPEPGSLALLGLGGLCVLRRRRN